MQYAALIIGIAGMLLSAGWAIDVHKKMGSSFDMHVAVSLFILYAIAAVMGFSVAVGA